MKRLLLFVLAGLVFVASGCSQAAPTEVVVQVTSVEAAEPIETSPVIEVSPTAETMPASFEKNRRALEEMGYTFQWGRGIELVGSNGNVIASSIDGLTISIYGQNGELTIFPEQAFAITKTSGLGMENLLTLSNTQGEVTQTYLENGAYWAPLTEIQRNPREIENYPRVPIEALWSGQLAQSEALTAEPFPEGTVPPDGLAYVLWRGNQLHWVTLDSVINGQGNFNNESHYLTFHYRWANFYRSTTPEGVEIIIATEQTLLPDGETSMFLHYIFGPEWGWEENGSYTNFRLNLIESVFLAYTQPAEPGRSLVVRPVVFIDSYDPNFPLEHFGNGVSGEQPIATEELYKLPQNNPSESIPEIIDLANNRLPEITGNSVYLEWANHEGFKEWQTMGFYANWGQTLFHQDSFFRGFTQTNP
ncbi:MAG: hypothetical protein KIT46_09125 [Anaerolineales bacterium]|nr:hypothetical protein [Anaerolineales bacterium]